MNRYSRSAVVFCCLLGAASAGSAQDCALMGATELVGRLTYCASSVLGSQSGNRYGPGNLMDGNNATSWCEGARGNGEGQEISISIRDGIPFRRLIVQNGYGKSSKSYRENGRVRTMEIRTDRGDAIRVQLPDRPDEVIIEIPGPVEYRQLRLVIVDVYPGSKYQDTCINFLTPDFQYERYLELKSQGLL